MIHIFHGFLGSAEDFNYLKNDKVILHDLYKMSETPVIGPDDILIGYSMGGRVAMDLARKSNYNLHKLVLINAHPGLPDEELKIHRKEFETKVLQELKVRTKDNFLDWWNSLPIFTFDQPIDVSDERFQQSSALFTRYLLSEQENHLPLMQKHHEKILYIAGLFDEKYMELVSEVLLPSGIAVKGIPGGHRLFQHPNELKQILQEEGLI
jgi:pimeloyl-ACP methyl ester carboxylesterase